MATRLVAVRLPPARFPDALDRVWDAGHVALPLPWNTPDRAVDRTVRALQPAALVDETGTTTLVTAPASDGPRATDGRAPSDPLPSDAALVVPTSGSTGPPKGVVLTHEALRAATSASVARLGAAPGDRFTLALPLHHVAGIQILLRSRACGTDAEILDPTLPAAQALAGADGQHLSLVPTQLARLLDAEVELRRWRTILLGGAAAPPALLERAAAAGARVVTSYGMTETCGGCVYDGWPLDGVEVTGRDDGRLLIRGPMLFAGYLRDPDATAAAFDADGWFVTGDTGRVARDGSLTITGRADDVIVSGGENVPAGVVADALREDPDILEVAVIGIEDATWGQLVVAVVVPRDLEHPPTLDEVRACVRRELPAAYAPRRLIVLDALPRDPMGKVAVGRLRDRITRPTSTAPSP